MLFTIDSIITPAVFSLFIYIPILILPLIGLNAKITSEFLINLIRLLLFHVDKLILNK